MIREFCQRTLGAARKFLRDQSGSIVIYTGAFMAVGVGGAALSIDIGRIVLLKTQLQNFADSTAMAGAAQLDAQPGAVTRAGMVIENSTQAYEEQANLEGEMINIEPPVFFEAADDYISRGAPTTDDVRARFVEVVLSRITLSFFYAPAMNVMTGSSPSNYAEIGARAVAMSDPFICKTLPMMICNPMEDSDPTTPDAIPTTEDFAGMSIILKPGTHDGTDQWAPGNFGLLELPSDEIEYTGSGAQAIQEALSAEVPSGCYGYNLLTEPGAKNVKVETGLNTRFGQPETDSTVRPAPNVMAYPKDQTPHDVYPAVVGKGDWNLLGYWLDNHPGVALPDVLVGASRYKVYLFEQDHPFYHRNGKKHVKFTVTELDKANGWTLIEPSVYDPDAAVIPTNPSDPDDVWTDGEPPPGQTVAEIGQERRVMRVNVMNCTNHEVRGQGTYPSEGGYVELFITEPAESPGDGGGIFAEFIQKLNPRISLEFHGNVRLVE